MAIRRMLTGIQPSGDLHLGNYLGMVRQVLSFQETDDVYLMIADLHAQTVPYNPLEFKNRILDLGKSLLALGVDPKKLVFFRQSEIPEHLYLYWILGTLTPLGELTRMHQYKEKKERYEHVGIGAGILMYPVLMAADILLYQSDVVPVGEDQVQHVEITRELARKYNGAFGEAFKIPQELLIKETARVMSLDNPEKKMSKSLPEGNLPLFEQEQEIVQKIKSAVTDSGSEEIFNEREKQGIANLMVIYKELTGKTITDIEQEFKGVGYGVFKQAVVESFLSFFKDSRKKKENISDHQVLKVFEEGKEKAQSVARETLYIVLQQTGLK